jgi:hypothetical protein
MGFRHFQWIQELPLPYLRVQLSCLSQPSVLKGFTCRDSQFGVPEEYLHQQLTCGMKLWFKLNFQLSVKVCLNRWTSLGTVLHPRDLVNRIVLGSSQKQQRLIHHVIEDAVNNSDVR